MRRSLRLAACLLIAASMAGGCRTVGTVGGTAGRAAGDTAEAAGDAAGTAARGAGNIIEKGADAADRELDD
jgi:hypothetical protein